MGEKKKLGQKLFFGFPPTSPPPRATFTTAPGALTLQSPHHFTGSGGVPKLPTLNGK